MSTDASLMSKVKPSPPSKRKQYRIGFSAPWQLIQDMETKTRIEKDETECHVQQDQKSVDDDGEEVVWCLYLHAERVAAHLLDAAFVTKPACLAGSWELAQGEFGMMLWASGSKTIESSNGLAKGKWRAQR